MQFYGILVNGHLKIDLGVRTFSWTIQTAKPRLCLYSNGLIAPKDILLCFLQAQIPQFCKDFSPGTGGEFFKVVSLTNRASCSSDRQKSAGGYGEQDGLS